MIGYSDFIDKMVYHLLDCEVSGHEAYTAIARAAEIIYGEKRNATYKLLEMDCESHRICSECGALISEGFMLDDDTWYCCEDCFNEAMEDGVFRPSPADECDDEYVNAAEGYYDERVNGQWVPTSIFWTEWVY